MNHRLTIPAVVTAVFLGAACGSGSSSNTNAPGEDGSLTLDYTAYIEGAIQPSGIGVDAATTMGVIVTDFERVVLVDLETQNVITEFGVGRNELPRQGATEGVAFLDDRVAVLYPDDRVVGLFDLEGRPLEEITITTDGRLDGALTVIDGSLIVVTRSAGSATLLRVDPGAGTSTELALSGTTESFEGLSPDASAGAVAVTAEGKVVHIDLVSGAVTDIGEVMEVADPSGVEVFVDLAEGEIQYGVTDDDDQYNAEPSPLRLFLA